MKMLLVFTFLMISGQVYAFSDWQSRSILVESNSEIQGMIDSIVIDIFHSPLQKTLCEVYQNSFSVYHSLGVSAEAAKQSFKECTEMPTLPSKALRKQYYLTFISMPTLDSWTDYGNRTYLFVEDGLSYERLKSLILHEMAISLDAKTNLLYTTYQTYFANRSGYSDNEALKGAFNQSTWEPLRLSFAAIRAFHFELYYHKKSYAMDHQTCAQSVLEILPQIKNIPTGPRSTGAESLNETLADMMSNRFTPKSEDHEKMILEQILSDAPLLVNGAGQKVTFCQFMTEPSVTGRSLYNFFGSGPRPRLTGGSGGQSSYVPPWEKIQQIPEGIISEKISPNEIRLQKNIQEIRTRIESVEKEKALKWTRLKMEE